MKKTLIALLFACSFMLVSSLQAEAYTGQWRYLDDGGIFTNVTTPVEATNAVNGETDVDLKDLKKGESVARGWNSDRYEQAEHSLRAGGAAVTRVRSTRYARAEQSLRAGGAAVTRIRSSRMRRLGTPFALVYGRFFTAPALPAPSPTLPAREPTSGRITGGFRPVLGPPHHAARLRAWQAGLREPPPPDAGRRGIRSSA